MRFFLINIKVLDGLVVVLCGFYVGVCVREREKERESRLV